MGFSPLVTRLGVHLLALFLTWYIYQKGKVKEVIEWAGEVCYYGNREFTCSCVWEVYGRSVAHSLGEICTGFSYVQGNLHYTLTKSTIL